LFETLLISKEESFNLVQELDFGY